MTDNADQLPFPDVGLVLAAAGRSERFGAENKLLFKLQGEPVVVRSLRQFSGIVPANRVVVVVSPENRTEIADAIEKHGFGCCMLVEGGRRRQDSVLHGLRCLRGTVDIVLVHDAARPFVQPKVIHQCILTIREKGAAIVARKVIDTIKETDAAGHVLRTLDRQFLWAAETPQGAKLETLLQALEQGDGNGSVFTDEAQALETSGISVTIVENPTLSPKLTTFADLPLFLALTEL